MTSCAPEHNTGIARITLLHCDRQMLNEHIQLVERRLVKEETIPHAEKVFSIFQTYTEMIRKGKLHPGVEKGKKLAITTDQHYLMVGRQIAENQPENPPKTPTSKGVVPRNARKNLEFSQKPAKNNLNRPRGRQKGTMENQQCNNILKYSHTIFSKTLFS
jgi:hypothetical protein